MVDEKGDQTDLVPANQTESSPFPASPNQTSSGFRKFVERFKPEPERLTLEPELLESYRQGALADVRYDLDWATRFQTGNKFDKDSYMTAAWFFQKAGMFAFTFPDSVFDFEMSDEMIETGKQFMETKASQDTLRPFAVAELIVAMKQIQAVKGLESDFEQFRGLVLWRNDVRDGVIKKEKYIDDSRTMRVGEVGSIELAFPGEGKKIMEDLGLTWKKVRSGFEEDFAKIQSSGDGHIHGDLICNLAGAKVLFPNDFPSLKVNTVWQEIQAAFKKYPELKDAQALLILSTPSEMLVNSPSQLYIHPRTNPSEHAPAPQLAEGQKSIDSQ